MDDFAEENELKFGNFLLILPPRGRVLEGNFLEKLKVQRTIHLAAGWL